MVIWTITKVARIVDINYLVGICGTDCLPFTQFQSSSVIGCQVVIILFVKCFGSFVLTVASQVSSITGFASGT